MSLTKKNHLQYEKSPYLLQHAENPVSWYPWGKEALEKARTENKPILVSIGYSSCHWCHVMEHESFSKEEVAGVMNEHFVNIKVDREERPDIDQIYMDAVQAMGTQGGWPLNVFLTFSFSSASVSASMITNESSAYEITSSSINRSIATVTKQKRGADNVLPCMHPIPGVHLLDFDDPTFTRMNLLAM